MIPAYIHPSLANPWCKVAFFAIEAAEEHFTGHIQGDCPVSARTCVDGVDALVGV